MKLLVDRQDKKENHVFNIDMKADRSIALPTDYRVRLSAKNDLRLKAVLEYLVDHQFVLHDELVEMLKARYLPAALYSTGNLDRDTALRCIAKLQSYIIEIELLCSHLHQ